MPRYICEVKRNRQNNSVMPISGERFSDLSSKPDDMRLSLGNITGRDNCVQSERSGRHED